MNNLPPGYLTESDEMVLNVMALDCKLSIDLGTCNGRSAAVLSHHSERVVTIDLFEDCEKIVNVGSRDHYKKLFERSPHFYSDVKADLARFTNVEVMKGLTHTHALLFEDKIVDLVFFDADHSYNGVLRDYIAWFPKVKHGGKFLFHDATNDNWDVRTFCDQVMLPDNAVYEINVEITNSVIRVFKKV